MMNNRKPRVAFICVHNSCRSQIAEALGKKFAGEIFESYSAGTETKSRINQDAVRLVKKIYGIDMEKTQGSKLLSGLPKEIDVVIKMGCQVACPYMPGKHEEDWALEDPTGKSDEEFALLIAEIEKKVKDLAQRIKTYGVAGVNIKTSINSKLRGGSA
jgi:arsenate reductase